MHRIPKWYLSNLNCTQECKNFLMYLQEHKTHLNSILSSHELLNNNIFQADNAMIHAFVQLLPFSFCGYRKMNLK